MTPFHAPYAPDDALLATQFLATAALPPAREARIDAEATRLIHAIRASNSGIGGIEALLREYSLSTPEGLALMVLAEGLLRVPDDATADRLIEDKLGQGGFARPHQNGAAETRPDSLLVGASAWALGLSARLVTPADTPEGILRGVVRRLGLPTVRSALRQAMRVMGNHFVLGQTIEEALPPCGFAHRQAVPLQFRHARRRRTHRRGRRPLPGQLRRRDCRHRRGGRQPAPAGPPWHIRQIVRPAPAL